MRYSLTTAILASAVTTSYAFAFVKSPTIAQKVRKTRVVNSKMPFKYNIITASKVNTLSGC